MARSVIRSKMSSDPRFNFGLKLEPWNWSIKSDPSMPVGWPWKCGGKKGQGGYQMISQGISESRNDRKTETQNDQVHGSKINKFVDFDPIVSPQMFKLWGFKLPSWFWSFELAITRVCGFEQKKRDQTQLLDPRPKSSVPVTWIHKYVEFFCAHKNGGRLMHISYPGHFSPRPHSAKTKHKTNIPLSQHARRL